MYNPEHLAKEATRLKHDEILNHALNDIRREALEALARADVENVIEMLKLQQRVAVVEEIRTTLDRWIEAIDTGPDTDSYA